MPDISVHGSDEVADVTGAGDTVIATFTLALASGASYYEAARLANYAGGIVVMKYGTRPVMLEELADPKWKGRFTIAKPIFGTTLSHLSALVLALGEEKAFKMFRAWRENGSVVSLTYTSPGSASV